MIRGSIGQKDDIIQIEDTELSWLEQSNHNSKECSCVHWDYMLKNRSWAGYGSWVVVC